MAKVKETTTIDASAYGYEKTRVVGKDGKTKSSVGNGDAVQRALLKFTAAGGDIGKVIRANKLPQDPAQYDNQGLLRMSVGNSLRARVKKGEHVIIGDVTVKSLEQRVALDEVKGGDAPAPRKPKAAKKAAPRKRKAEPVAEAEAA